jgi:DNA-binding transcriptional LysR family regulator
VVDLRSTDNEPDFTRGEADGDIRYQLDSDHATPPRGIRTEELARPPVFPVAAPEVVARPPADLAALLALPLIQEGPIHEWRDWLAAQGGPAHTLPAPAVRYAQAHLALAAARAGRWRWPIPCWRQRIWPPGGWWRSPAFAARRWAPTPSVAAAAAGASRRSSVSASG